LFEYTNVRRTPLEIEDARMMASIVELLFGLFCSALILLVGSSTAGSIVAALRGISHGSDSGRDDPKQILGVAEMTALHNRMIEPGIIAMTNLENHYGL
jgi:hypothetical protein